MSKYHYPQDVPAQYLNDYITQAVKHGDEKTVLLILHDRRYRPGPELPHLLPMAIQESDDTMFSILLDDGRIDPTANNNLPLKMALKLGEFHMATILFNDPRVRKTLGPADVRAIQTRLLQIYNEQRRIRSKL